jgi:succinate dehydrogenase / fumarate reductase flavoprotein subunit/fumarate reductase (CoM/CoB) subunit A
MWEKVGVLRTGDKLSAALTRIRELRVALADMVPADDAEFNMTLQDWYDLRSALLTAESVTLAAINRTESRGAHQREDFEEMDPAQVRNQRLRLGDDGAVLSDYLPVAKGVAA